ncbi:DUF5592 family protein [Terrisporobacter muris]|uniref:DUF5592 family protein n=1 Tax=Terrisporobacter muris TaxID=2963284 RepID=A0A9X2S0L0_9FIRM|nr:DUF5592 family protein [Terrisporobacter muris]MCR1821879.1 DUF5592 family protein [Terrisporobacter muris]
MYSIPKEINSETKVFRSIYLFDLFFIIVSLIFTTTTAQLVSPKLSAMYYIFSIIVTFFLLSKSKSNPGIRNYRAIYIMIRRTRKTYKSLDWNFEGRK